MKTDPKNQNAFRAPSHPEQAETDNNVHHDEAKVSRFGPSAIHDEITAQIVEMLEAGVAPWRCGILATNGDPRSFDRGKPYRGVNIFLLTFQAFKHGYRSPYWLTFRQALASGGNVRQGEKGSLVVFWKKAELRDEVSGEELPEIPFHPIAEAQRIVASYKQGPAVEHKGFYAFYRPATDTVRIPEPEQFTAPSEYYATLFHELAHSTGHHRRLNRKLDTEPQPFGALEYGREELVAEMAAAFLCRRAGISPAVIENQAAYIQGWLKQIRQDKKLVISAAGAAQKASDWILGENFDASNLDA